MTWTSARSVRGVACRVAALALGIVGGCSDDGLTPTGGGTAADGGAGGSTGSVSTTVTASAGAGDPAASGQLDDGGGPGDGTAALSDSTADDASGALEDGRLDTDGLGDSSGLGATGVASTDDGGSEGAGDTGPGPSGRACVTAADCAVIDDCCTCAAAGAGDPEPACLEQCRATQCEAAGIDAPAVECVFGQCRLEKVACNGAFLACDQPAPDCPDGMLPSVGGDASCWTGACVPAELCDVVPDCSWCASNEACVLTSTQIAPLWSCWPIDPTCSGAPSCACMAEVCTAPFQCGDPGAGAHDLTCHCPVCG